MLDKTPKEIFFGQKDSELKWVPITDKLVGGLSNALINLEEDYLEFKGELKPIFEKSWVGMRSVKNSFDLSKYKFIELKIKTDGRPYHFQMEHDESWQKDKLGTVIDIVANQWKVMHIEMESFKIHTFEKGFIKREPNLNQLLGLIRRFNIQSYSKEASDFNFQIEYLKFH